MPSILDLERAALRAELAFHLAGAEWVRARLSWLDAGGVAAPAPPLPDHLDLDHGFRPEWKAGDRLTARGAEAILSAYDRRMKIEETSALFRIAARSASAWRVRWRKTRDAASVLTTGENP